MKSEFQTERDTIIHLENLEMGEYALLVDIDWISDHTNREFVISSYGVETKYFQEDEGDKFNLCEILTGMFSDFPKSNPPIYQPKPL